MWTLIPAPLVSVVKSFNCTCYKFHFLFIICYLKLYLCCSRVTKTVDSNSKEARNVKKEEESKKSDVTPATKPVAFGG